MIERAQVEALQAEWYNTRELLKQRATALVDELKTIQEQVLAFDGALHAATTILALNDQDPVAPAPVVPETPVTE